MVCLAPPLHILEVVRGLTILNRVRFIKMYAAQSKTHEAWDHVSRSANHGSRFNGPYAAATHTRCACQM